MSFAFDERGTPGTPGIRGRLRGRAASPEWLPQVWPHIAKLSAPLSAPLSVPARSFVERIVLDSGATLWVKGSPLRGRARVRHTLRQKVARQGLPRTREFENLRWLRAHLFRAPEPLLAGWIETVGSASFQFLATAEVDEGRPLVATWPALDAATRQAVILELGREVARLHALGFVHRDLYVRNLLLTPPAAGRRLVFLDAWRGGPHAIGRGPAYDLACLSLQGEQVFTHAEQALFFATYRAEGRAQDAHLASRDALTFERAVLKERTKLIRQIERDPARARGLPPTRAWRPPLA